MGNSERGGHKLKKGIRKSIASSGFWGSWRTGRLSTIRSRPEIKEKVITFLTAHSEELRLGREPDPEGGEGRKQTGMGKGVRGQIGGWARGV